MKKICLVIALIFGVLMSAFLLDLANLEGIGNIIDKFKSDK